LSAAPYALQTRGITVNENDLVGIGTTTPGKKLTVAGDMELGITSGDYRHLRIGGGNSDGFIYGSFPALGDGIHLGYNYFADAEGNDQVVHSGLGTSRITVGDGYVTLATGGTGFLPTNYLTLDRFGFVGIGTTTPSAELEVHGDILLGNGGQFFVPAGEEKLRLLRGNVDGDGTIDDGTGFSVTRLEEGIYRITFSEGFRGTPSLTVTPKRPFSDQNRAAHILGVNFDDATIDFRFSDGEHTDSDFSFCVIGRR
jgi:hypothetical protein